MREYIEGKLSIPYDDMIELKNEGRLELGLENHIATQLILDASKYGISLEKSVIGAGHFWSWVAVGLFIYSLYLSYASAWWWFILGFIMMSSIHKANRKSNSENILEQALRDKTMYEQIREADLWMYLTSEDIANKYQI
tara:strand:- start:98 stop:514 length:417 start_codon:yes stop_codon:yes gene_type:complete